MIAEKTEKIECFTFECLGVRINLSCNEFQLLEKIKFILPEILPLHLSEISVNAPKQLHTFSFTQDQFSGKIKLSKDDELVSETVKFEDLIDSFASSLRLTIAEFTEEVAVLHAGVIGWGKKTVVIPGKSFTGKTTLVAEFLRNECEYFSDEYALIDKNGLVHPFPKKLSMRGIIDDYRQLDLEVSHFGGKVTGKPLPIGVLLVTEYDKSYKGAMTDLKEISAGEGIMAALANSISIRRNPNFVLEILSNAINGSLVLQSKRGEASKFVKKFFRYFKKNGVPRI